MIGPLEAALTLASVALYAELVCSENCLGAQLANFL